MPKPVTIEKLQSFVEAVEFASDVEVPEDFVPSARQWKRIREMIFALDDVPTLTQVVQAAPPAGPVYREAAPVQIPASSTLAVPSAPPAIAAGPSPAEILARRAAAGQLPGVGGASGGFAGGPDGRALTPNIDTSNGQYSSSFV